EVSGFERVGVLGRPVGVIAVVGVKRIQSRVEPFGALLVGNSGVDASEPENWVSRVAVREYDPIRWSEPGKVIAALDELVGSLADGRPVFRNRLIKAHRHSAAAIAVENHLTHLLNVPEVVYALCDVQRYQLPINQSFVVFKSRVHAENHK